MGTRGGSSPPQLDRTCFCRRESSCGGHGAWLTASLHDEHAARVGDDRGLIVGHNLAAEGGLGPVQELVGVVVHHSDAVGVVAIGVGGDEVGGDDGGLGGRAAGARDHALD